jgi:hypothetical protein
MPARHTSLQDHLLLEANSTGGSGRRKRVSARHQVKRLDRPFEGFALSKTGPAEETGFLRSVRVSWSAISPSPTKAHVKSGPDVFADALVPLPALPMPGPQFPQDL